MKSRAGGLPRGRPTLVCGSAGSGKTLLAMEFLVRGARDFNEPGVYLAFEETAPELAVNVASLGFDVPRLIEERKFCIDSVQINRAELQEAGEYDLEGLFIRLGESIDQVGAKRVVLDTIEVLFGVFQNSVIVRSGATQSNSTVSFNGTAAAVTSWSSTQIISTVPAGTTDGPITVQVGGLTAQSANFLVDLVAQLTDSFGNTSTYVSDIYGGQRRVVRSTGSGCSSCTQRGVVQTTYDANGNVLTRADEVGHTITMFRRIRRTLTVASL